MNAGMLIHVWLFATPVECSLPGPSVHGISQARILEWIVISFSRGSFWPRDWTGISRVSCTGRRVLYPQQSKGRDYNLWTHTNCRELCWVIKDNSKRSRLARFHLYHILEIMKSRNWRKVSVVARSRRGWRVAVARTDNMRKTYCDGNVLHLPFLNISFSAVLLLYRFYKTSPFGGSG